MRKKEGKLLALLILSATLSAQGQSEISLPDFELTSTSGKIYSRDDFDDKKLLAIVFLSNHCRVSQIFQNHIMQIKKLFAQESISIIAVSPNYEDAILPDELAYSDLGDSFEEMKKRAERKKTQT